LHIEGGGRGRVKKTEDRVKNPMILITMSVNHASLVKKILLVKVRRRNGYPYDDKVINLHS
jgi:hypothetical protein